MQHHRLAQIIFVLTLVIIAIGLVFSPSESRNKIWPTIESAQAAEGSQTLLIPLMFFQSPHTSLFGVEMSRFSDYYGFREMAEANAPWVRRNGL